jgi:hypothetical protein
MYSGKIAVPPGGGGIVDNNNRIDHFKIYFHKNFKFHKCVAPYSCGGIWTKEATDR